MSMKPITSVQSPGVSSSEHATTGALRICCDDNTCSSGSLRRSLGFANILTVMKLHLTLSAWSTVQSKRRTTGVCGSGRMDCNFVEVNSERVDDDAASSPLGSSRDIAKSKL